jgi:hypothetical protein
LELSSQTLHALVDALSRRLQTANWALGALPSEQKTATPTALAQHMH